MSLIALIATSVSAYAVSEHELGVGRVRHAPARGTRRRSSPACAGRTRSARPGARAARTRRSTSSASAPDVARDDLVLGAVLPAQIARDRLRDGRIVVDRQDRRLGHPGVRVLRAPAEDREQLRLQWRVVGYGYRRREHAGLLQMFGDRQRALVHQLGKLRIELFVGADAAARDPTSGSSASVVISQQYSAVGFSPDDTTPCRRARPARRTRASDSATAASHAATGSSPSWSPSRRSADVGDGRAARRAAAPTAARPRRD